MVILKNIIRCNLCGDVIESEHVHDYQTCMCGAVAIDGGKDYLKRSFMYSFDDIEELSEIVTMTGSPVSIGVLSNGQIGEDCPEDR